MTANVRQLLFHRVTVQLTVTDDVSSPAGFTTPAWVLTRFFFFKLLLLPWLPPVLWLSRVIGGRILIFNPSGALRAPLLGPTGAGPLIEMPPPGGGVPVCIPPTPGPYECAPHGCRGGAGRLPPVLLGPPMLDAPLLPSPTARPGGEGAIPLPTGR